MRCWRNWAAVSIFLTTRSRRKAEPFSFSDWQLADKPLVRDRLVFDWHNFLSGCSTWNLPDWQSWIRQSQKMRYNAVMVHAYGNNPMVSFSFNGKTKPVGYLSTTVQGRDWSTMHVNDVRRLWGGEVFDQPAFGADGGAGAARTAGWPRRRSSCTTCSLTPGSATWTSILPTTWTPSRPIRRS